MGVLTVCRGRNEYQEAKDHTQGHRAATMGSSDVYLDLPHIPVAWIVVGSRMHSHPEQPDIGLGSQFFQQQGGHGDLGSCI